MRVLFLFAYGKKKLTAAILCDNIYLVKLNNEKCECKERRGLMPDTPDTARFERQLKKGVLEMLVLRLLAEHPSHGYELIQRLRRGSDGALDLKEGTLYPILYRLEDDGCITSAWQNTAPDKQRPVPRKVYTVTPLGQQVLTRQVETWQAFAACVEKFCKEETP